MINTELPKLIARVDQLESEIKRVSHDDLQIRQQLVAAEEALQHMNATMSNLETNLDKTEAALKSQKTLLSNKVRQETSSYIKSQIKKYSPIIAALVLLPPGVLLASLWAFQPLRLYVMDTLNSALRLDDYIAYKLNDDTHFPEDQKNPIGLAVTNHVSEQLQEFARSADYTPQSAFKQIVAQSFSHRFSINYDQTKDTTKEMRFYSTGNDAPWLFCSFALGGTVMPPSIEFELDNTQQPDLTYNPSAPYGLHKKRISLKETFSPLGSGMHCLVMRVKPPTASMPISEPQQKAFDEQLRASSLTADCIIAVVGRSDAQPLIQPQ